MRKTYGHERAAPRGGAAEVSTSKRRRRLDVGAHEIAIVGELSDDWAGPVVPPSQLMMPGSDLGALAVR
jgi:hypothetical protein